jgi:hypothetical protein
MRPATKRSKKMPRMMAMATTASLGTGSWRETE